ncbi:hypothetical protein SAMN06269173_11466, partial [Hymenobacter mucosus]
SLNKRNVPNVSTSTYYRGYTITILNVLGIKYRVHVGALFLCITTT